MADRDAYAAMESAEVERLETHLLAGSHPRARSAVRSLLPTVYVRQRAYATAAELARRRAEALPHDPEEG